MSKVWCDGYNPDIIWDDVNMCSEDIVLLAHEDISYPQMKASIDQTANASQNGRFTVTSKRSLKPTNVYNWKEVRFWSLDLRI